MESQLHEEKILVTAKEAARALSLSRSMIFRLLKSGQLHGVQIGRARRITVASVKALGSMLAGQVAP